MKCENKELFIFEFYVVSHNALLSSRKSAELKFSVFIFSQRPNFLVSSLLHPSRLLSLNHSLYLPHSDGDLEGIPSVFVQTHITLRFLFSLPSLPLFSLAGSVSLPRDSRVLCSRYRPIDFGREKKNCGHDSPCMNLMIPVLSVPPFQKGREPINHTAFLSPSLQACQ